VLCVLMSQEIVSFNEFCVLLMLKVSNAETSCVAVTLFILQGNTCEMGHNIKFLRSHGLSQWWPIMECVLRTFLV